MTKINQMKQKLFSFILFTIISVPLFAQAGDGNAGIKAANVLVKGYFDDVTTLMFAIAAIVGLVGAIRVYIAWNNGDQDINKKIMGWFGAIIFIVLVGVVLKAFFGV